MIKEVMNRIIADFTKNLYANNGSNRELGKLYAYNVTGEPAIVLPIKQALLHMILNELKRKVLIKSISIEPGLNEVVKVPANLDYVDYRLNIISLVKVEFYEKFEGGGLSNKVQTLNHSIQVPFDVLINDNDMNDVVLYYIDNI